MRVGLLVLLIGVGLFANPLAVQAATQPKCAPDQPT
jgi:hypothetical protein